VDGGANTAAGFPFLNALTVNHDARLTIDTSFTGQDLFRVLLRSGNFGPSGFFSNPPTPLSRLDFAVEEPLCRVEDATCSRNLVSVNRAYVPIPLGPEIRLSAGSRLVQLDLLPVWPSLANDSPILDLFQPAGAAGAYSRRLGSGFGAWWQPEGRLRGLSIAYAAVAPQADNGSPGEGGLFTAAGGQTNTVQVPTPGPLGTSAPPTPAMASMPCCGVPLWPASSPPTAAMAPSTPGRGRGSPGCAPPPGVWASTGAICSAPGTASRRLCFG
jgi:hypothetical protein